jgi:AcrR family transcriptional regulator
MMNLVKGSPQDVSTKRQRSPASPGRPRGQKSGSANREQLMDIALALFARHGIARISLNAIAKEAGVTPAMLHYYFSSREALVEKLVEERFMPLRSEIGQIFVAHGDDPVTAFTLLIEPWRHGGEKRVVRAAVDAGDHRRDAGAAPAYARAFWR